MITVTIYGLDQYIVGDLSNEITPLLAQLYEVSEDEINFIAPNCMVFHKGAEQTSWNTLVRVHLPKKIQILQDKAADILLNMIKGPTINVAVEFYYYSQDDRYQKIDDTYPRFISADNEVDGPVGYSDEIEEGEGEDQLYTGDIFKDFKK